MQCPGALTALGGYSGPWRALGGLPRSVYCGRAGGGWPSSTPYGEGSQGGAKVRAPDIAEPGLLVGYGPRGGGS